MIEGISRSIPSYGISPMGLSSPVKTALTTLVALAVLSNLPQVSAGGKEYQLCMEACCGNASGWWGLIACGVICSPTLGM